MSLNQFKGKTLLKYKTIIPLAEKFAYVFLQQNRVALARSYNYHPLEYLTPIRTSVYDFQADSIYSDLIPSFDAIEFSHFAPRHWIDASDHQFLVSQTTSYNISIYNYYRQKVDSITRNPVGWNYIHSTFLTKFREADVVKKHQAKELINVFSPVEDSISDLNR